MGRLRISTQSCASGTPSSTTFLRGDDTWATPAAGSLTVQDENTNISTGVTQIDFQGAGVTATAGTGEVIVTIPGGSSATTFASLEKFRVE